MLAQPPVTLLEVPEDGPALAALLDRLRRDGGTPRPVRRLLSDRRLPAWLLGRSAAGYSSGLLLTVLTRAQRMAELPDGSLWLMTLLAWGKARRVAWVRLQRPDRQAGAVEQQVDGPESYGLPAELGALRDELVLIAMQSRWRPPAPRERQVLLLLGPRAAAHLAGQVEELQAQVAVDGVHLSVVAVPPDSSGRSWIRARDRAMTGGATVLHASGPGEHGVRRILEALDGSRLARTVTALQPADGEGWSPAAVLAGLRGAGALPPADESGSALRPPPPRVPSPRPEPPHPRPEPGRVVEQEVYLAKFDSAPGFDKLRLTGRRCSHKSSTRIRPGKAAKKYKGIERFLRAMDPPGRLIRAELCTHSGCGVIRVKFETVLSAVPAEEDAAPASPGP